MKKVFLFIIISPMILFGQQEECLLGNCKDGFGIYRHGNGDLYCGEWQNSKQNGFGYIELHNGGIILGKFSNNKLNGYCLLDSTNIMYVGSIQNNQISGYGYRELRNTEVYRGEFENGMKNGIGLRYNILNDEFHRGDWENDKIDAKAKKIKSGCLIGKCKKDKKGFYMNPNGTIVIGNWGKKTITGEGFLSTSSTIQVGEYLNGEMNGTGLMYWAGTTELFYGNWKNNRTSEGYCILKRNDGEIYIGKVNESRKNNGQGISIIPSKNKPTEFYIGEWLNGKIIKEKTKKISF